MLDININDIFFKSYSVDPKFNQSIYVFDSTYLPSPVEVGNKQVYELLINELTDRLVSKLPSAPYSLVVFTSGFSEKKISWVYGIKMFNKIPIEARHYLQQTFIVHESFFIRTVYQVLSNAMSIKFPGTSNNSISNDEKLDNINLGSTTITHVYDLTELSHLIDITRLRISLNVYLHDYEISEYIEVPNNYFDRITPQANNQYRQLVFDKIFRRLKADAQNSELIFQKPGSYKKVNILLDIINRNNYIDLSQWDIYSLASVFLHFIKTKSKPLILIDMINLPILDDFDYTYKTFQNIINKNNYQDFLFSILPVFRSIIRNSEITKMDARSLSKALAPTLCREKISLSNNDKLAIGGRFIRNLLTHLDDIKNTYISSKTPMRRSVSAVETSPRKNINNNTDNPNTHLKHLRVVSQPPLLPKPRKTPLRTRSPSPETTPMIDTIGNPTSIKSLTLNEKDNNNKNSLFDLPPPIKPNNNNTNDFISPISLYSSPNTHHRNSSVTVTPILKNKISNGSLRADSNENSSIHSSNTTKSINSSLKPAFLPSPATDNTQNSQFQSSRSFTSPTPTPITNIDMMVTDTSAIEEMIFDTKKLALVADEKQEKIVKFDRELKMRKKQEKITINTKATKFSTDSYSDIKTGNKVNKLAALYEERLLGVKALDEIQKHTQ